MGLTLKDVYDMRNGMIDFTRKLFSDNSNFTYKNSGNLMKTLAEAPKFFKEFSKDTAPNKDDKASKKAFEERKNKYLKEFRISIKKSRDLVAQHKIALDVYSYLVEKNNELREANKNDLSNPVVVEFGRNVEIFKAQLLKNKIYSFEIDSKLKNDPKLDEKIKNGVSSVFKDENLDKLNEHGLFAINKIGEKFKKNFEKYIDSEFLDFFKPEDIEAKDEKFYGLIKNAGFSYARKFDAKYFAMSEELAKPLSGYIFDTNGKMIEKESKGFFETISNFFSRLINKGKVQEYNNSLEQSIDASNKETEAIGNYMDMNVLDSEKELIDLGEEFDKENEMTIDYNKELAVEMNLMKEEEKNRVMEEAVGPSLDQID